VAWEGLTAPASFQLRSWLLPRLSGPLESVVAFEIFTAQPLAYAREFARHVERVRPAAVVVDFTCPGAALAAEAAGIPWLSVFHVGLPYPGPGLPPPGNGIPFGARPSWSWPFILAFQKWMNWRLTGRLRAARRTLGLGGEPRTPDFWTSPWATLVTSAAQLEAPRYPLPPRTFFVGPLVGRASEPFELPATTRPRVYVSLGSVFNNRPSVYQRIIDGLRGRYQVIVSAGQACDRLRGGDDVHIHRSLPQLAILPQVDAVLSHGGVNTLNEALAAGKPLLVMPVGGEQGDNAARLVFLEAGLRTKLSASPEVIGALVDRLVREPGFGERARAVAEVLARLDGPGTALRFLQRILATGRPVERPDGFAETVEAGGALP
jgi:UDP:flavonoid glycosyltransferase YjiC (YdhE family)